MRNLFRADERPVIAISSRLTSAFRCCCWLPTSCVLSPVSRPPFLSPLHSRLSLFSFVPKKKREARFSACSPCRIRCCAGRRSPWGPTITALLHLRCYSRRSCREGWTSSVETGFALIGLSPARTTSVICFPAMDRFTPDAHDEHTDSGRVRKRYLEFASHSRTGGHVRSGSRGVASAKWSRGRES